MYELAEFVIGLFFKPFPFPCHHFSLSRSLCLSFTLILIHVSFHNVSHHYKIWLFTDADQSSLYVLTTLLPISFQREHWNSSFVVFQCRLHCALLEMSTEEAMNGWIPPQTAAPLGIALQKITS